ncbi:MAG: MFS transporter [Spirosomataceae bacterium]
MTFSEKRLLFLLACVNFTHIVDFMILMPLGPSLMQIFDLSPAQFGYLVGSYGFAAGASGFSLSFFADRFDRKKMLLFAYIGFTLGTAACALAPSFAGLLVARIVAGIFGGMIGSQVLSIVADTFPYERRASAMGVIMTAFSMASVVGVPGGLYLAQLGSWHTPFWMIAALGVLISWALYQFIPPMNQHIRDDVQSPWKVFVQIFQNSNQRRALQFTGLIMLGHFMIIPYIAPSLVANVGFKEEDIYLIYLVGGAATLITSPLIGKWADRQGKPPIFRLFALLSLIPVFLITHLDAGASIYVVLSYAVLFFVFSNGRLIPVQAMVSNVVTPQQRGSFMALNSSIQLWAQSLASAGSGLILIENADGTFANYNWVGYLSIGILLFTVYFVSTFQAKT